MFKVSPSAFGFRNALPQWAHPTRQVLPPRWWEEVWPTSTMDASQTVAASLSGKAAMTLEILRLAQHKEVDFVGNETFSLEMEPLASLLGAFWPPRKLTPDLKFLLDRPRAVQD